LTYGVYERVHHILRALPEIFEWRNYYRAARVKWRKIWPLSLISSTEVYWPSCQIDIFSPHPRLYTHHKFNNQTRYDDPTNQNPTLWERRVPELGDERKGWGRATNHWAQISFPRIPCQCISQKQIFRFPIIKAMNCTIDWFLLPLTLFRPDLPRPHPAHLHKESFKDVCTTYKQTHTFSKSKLCTATYIPFIDGVASDPQPYD